jgi:hypothetical protein
MTTNQAAIIIKEAIREAAKAAGLKPSVVHNPHRHDFAGVEARNHAIRLAYAQGVAADALAEGFVRNGRTIRDALGRRAALGECPRCGCTNPAECRDRCGSAPAVRESADIDGASLV